jgi:hypothetical protein
MFYGVCEEERIKERGRERRRRERTRGSESEGDCVLE